MTNRADRVAEWFEWPLVAAALLVLPVLILQVGDVGEPLEAAADVLNWAIWLVFAAYLVAMLAIVPDRWHWLRENPADVAIVILTPPVMPRAL